MKDVPGLLLALTVGCYWGCVLVLTLTRWLLERSQAGFFPRKPVERAIWPLWVLVVLAWNVLPWVALNSHQRGLALPEFTRDVPGLVELRALAGACAVVCLFLTISCWLRMGRSWAMAVLPTRVSPLVTTGMYAWVRHPIYTLSMILMVCSFLVVPTLPMGVTMAAHLFLLTLKVRSEEESLIALHGQVYVSYCQRTGRFLPRLIGPARG